MNKADKEGLVCPKCKAEITLAEARGMHIPTPETSDKEFQVDKFGNFRIVVGAATSPWTNVYNIAKVEHEGKKFFAVHPTGTLSRTFPPGVLFEIPELKQDTPAEEPKITEIPS